MKNHMDVGEGDIYEVVGRASVVGLIGIGEVVYRTSCWDVWDRFCNGSCRDRSMIEVGSDKESMEFRRNSSLQLSQDWGTYCRCK